MLSEYYVAYGQNQADASDAYKIEIERQALDNDATLSKLVVTIYGVAQTILQREHLKEHLIFQMLEMLLQLM